MNTQVIPRYAKAVFLVLFTFFGSTITAVGATPAYQVESTPFQWIDANTIPTVSDGPYVFIPIGFTFRYYDYSYNALAVTPRGYLAMPMSDIYYNYHKIMPYLDPALIQAAPASRIYTKLEGTSPNQKFTVSWIDMSYLGAVTCGDQYDSACEQASFGKVSFQATLYEGSNDIVFRYLDVVASDEASPSDINHDNGRTATVAVENLAQTEGTLYSKNQAVIQNGTALRFFSHGPVLNQAPIAVIMAGGGVTSVVQKTTVALNGSLSSDPDGTIVSYKWEQVAGVPVTLKNTTSAQASFIAPKTDKTIYVTFKLTVTDNQGATAIDQNALAVVKR